MAREIVQWCDVCLAEDVRASSRPYTVALEGGAPLVIDLCEADADRLLKPVSVLLAAYGVPLEVPATRPGKSRAAARTRAREIPDAAPVAAPVVDEPVEPAPKRETSSRKSKSKSSSSSSGKRLGKPPAHGRDRVCLWCGLTFASAHGLNTHVRTAHDAEPTLGGDCPLCGKTLGNTNALGAHIFRAHKSPSTTAAFAAARDNGDPFGVVKRAMAAATGSP